MEFVEAVNPHYAFPIVGVIVCCLLVFAFGFKSPGQPPSFDIVEDERKVVKKRKGKENQKVKPQQNGKVTSTVSTKVEAAPHTPKTKVTADKPGNKSESKSNKKSRLQQVTKQPEIGNKSEVVQSEDGNEDGWVQLVSKKERKNRKKDDVVPNIADVIKAVPAVVEVEPCLQVTENVEKSVSPKEVTAQIEKEKVNDTSDNAAEKETEDTKFTLKVQKSPKKKKGKKEEVEGNLESNSMKELPASEVLKENCVSSEKKSYTPISSGDIVLEPPVEDLLQVQEIADASEEEVKSKAKKKKSKKKNQETAAVDDIKIDTISVHVQEHNDVAEQQTIPKKEIIIEPKLVAVELQDSDDKQADPKDPATAPGSNVAFDELGDLCMDEKPQKKKKKVRREH